LGFAEREKYRQKVELLRGFQKALKEIRGWGKDEKTKYEV